MYPYMEIYVRSYPYRVALCLVSYPVEMLRAMPCTVPCGDPSRDPSMPCNAPCRDPILPCLAMLPVEIPTGSNLQVQFAIRFNLQLILLLKTSSCINSNT